MSKENIKTPRLGSTLEDSDHEESDYDMPALSSTADMKEDVNKNPIDEQANPQLKSKASSDRKNANPLKEKRFVRFEEK